MKIFLYSLLLFLIIACSDSSDSDDVIEDLPSTSYLISTIERLNAPNWDNGDYFIYEDDKLTASYLQGCTYSTQFYYLNELGKINRIDHGQGVGPRDESFDQELFNQNKTEETYEYDGSGRLVSKTFGNFKSTFQYDAEGRLILVDEYDLESEYYVESFSYTYDGDKINKIVQNYYYADSVYEYTFEFDDKINPLYYLFENYGLIYLETCYGLDYNSPPSDGVFSKYNVTKMYENGVLVYSCDITYDEKDRPIRYNYQEVEKGENNVLVISYQD